MKFLKEITIAILLVLFTVAPVYAATEEATAVITTYVGENITNAGIRITTDDQALVDFDTTFFAATSVINLENTSLDNSTNEVSGMFSVLVRRPTANPMEVSVTANPLTNGTGFLSYSLQSGNGNFAAIGTDTLNIGATNVTASYSTVGGVVEGVLRDQNIFTYIIPADNTKALGEYSGEIVFSITIT